MYKVCGVEGCFGSDSAAAVEQAILDGVDVINFSICGGTDPFTDPVELAFLDAYAAGVFVSASAGNDGPGAGTADHLVAVGHHGRRLDPDACVRLDPDARRRRRDTLTLTGSSITDGRRDRLPVVLSSAAPYSNPLATHAAAAGHVHGQDRRLPARRQRAASRRASTSCRAAPPG